MIILTVTISGQPVGKGRPRLTTRGGFARAFTPKKTRDWETMAAAVMRAAWGGRAPLERPVSVTIEVVCARPSRLLRRKDPDGRMWRPTRIDADNAAKAALDALQQANVVRDDMFVVDLHVRSLYTAKGEEPHVGITIGLVEGEP